MGGSPSAGAAPAAPQQINYNKLGGQINDQAATQYKALLAQQMGAYPKMEALQLGTIGTLAGNLNNPYTQEATRAVNQGLGNASLLNQQARKEFQISGPNALEQNLYNTANQQLSYGDQLTPEAARNATQGAMEAYNSAGLGTGAGAAAAGILGRFNTSQQLLGQREQAAGYADNIYTQNPLSRLGMASQLANQGSNIAYNGAQALLATDPYQRALAPGLNLGSSILGNSGNLLGQTYQGQNQLGGDVASFNQNMQGSLYNSYQNNRAALQGAQMAQTGQIIGGALSAAGSVGGAALICFVAREVYGEDDPAWKEFRSWLYMFASPRRFLRYLNHGPKIAAWIHEHPGYKERIRSWMDRCRGELHAWIAAEVAQAEEEKSHV